MKELYEKYRDIFWYLFWGGCTTLVNIGVYWLCAHPLHMKTTVSTVIAWFLTVLAAYLTNRKMVFHSQAEGVGEIAKEIVNFYVCRIATGGVDLLCMYVCVDLLHWNDMIVKIAVNVLVIVLNYVGSKLWVFREGGKGDL